MEIRELLLRLFRIKKAKRKKKAKPKVRKGRIIRRLKKRRKVRKKVELKKIKPVKVKDVMTRHVKTVEENDTLRDVVELFSRNKISGVPVVRGKKVVGVISESDIVRLVGADNILDIRDVRMLERTLVKDVMSKKPIVIGENDTLEDAIILMKQNDVNRLPVVNNKGELVGIIARADVIRGMMEILFFSAIKKGTLGIIVETDVDKLLSLIKKRPMTIEKLAKKLKKDVDQVESWVRILEEHGLVEVTYPPIGKPVVRRVG